MIPERYQRGDHAQENHLVKFGLIGKTVSDKNILSEFLNKIHGFAVAAIMFGHWDTLY